MNNLKSNKALPKIGILALVLVALPFILQAILGNEYWVMIACVCCVYVIAVSGLDILFGYSGQISMGHAAFFVIGTYTSGLLNNYFSIPLIITIPLGAILSAAIGAALAYPASKLKFHFLSLATVAFGEIVFYFLYVSPKIGDATIGFTGDYKGISIINISFLDNYVKWYFFLMVFVVLFLIAKQTIVHSRTGRAFIAIRENTHAANGMGVNVRKYKILAFTVSAFFTGFAGAIYGHLIRYISPETCKQKQSVLFLTMMLFGGTGTLAGPIIGVIILEILLEVIRPLQEYQMLLYGILMLIVIIGLPGGIYGGFKDLLVAQKRKKAEKEFAANKQ